jgi:hypothetical protein
MKRALLSALAALAFLPACAEPVRSPEAPPAATPPTSAGAAETRTVTRTVQGRTFRLTIHDSVALVSVDGRPLMRIRRESSLRHVTFWTPSGEVKEYRLTQRDLDAARAVCLPASAGRIAVGPPSFEDTGGCVKQWIAYAGWALVMVTTCAEGPTPACSAAVAATANALEDVIQCEQNAT